MGMAEGIALSVAFGQDHATFVKSVLAKTVFCRLGGT